MPRPMQYGQILPFDHMDALRRDVEGLGWQVEYWSDDDNRPFLRFISPDFQIMEVEMDGRITLAMNEYGDCVEVTDEVMQALLVCHKHLTRSQGAGA